MIKHSHSFPKLFGPAHSNSERGEVFGPAERQLIHLENDQNDKTLTTLFLNSEHREVSSGGKNLYLADNDSGLILINLVSCSV